ncbi:protein SICKLE [Rutidosis leptorrhynchoides]|uniref:protein SICKLE n=1 Tax=Rutidosis leptorrhynchoides TaxID=125765 RepID=UPI003A99E413
MEESEQRRERLKAMRMEASWEASTYNNESDYSAVNLSNPLLESTANNPESQGHSSAQSFNYYTDPMASYSGNKQRSKVSPQISQTHSSYHQRPLSNEILPPPSFQPRINQFPSPRMQQPQGQHVNPSYGGYHGPGSGYPSPQTHFTTGPARGSAQGAYPSPHFTNSPGRGSGQGYPSPGPGPGPYFINSPGQGRYPNPGPNQGSGQRWGSSMSSGPSFVRGRGQGSGQRGGWGQGGARDHVSAEHRPDMFYNKSMVEDPWKFLEPVVWKKSQKKKWLTTDAKKLRVSDSPTQQKQSSSQLSLAEILAASFNETEAEAATDEPNN